MRIADIIRHISNLFEKKRKNPLQLNNDSNLESNLKFLKVGDKSTPIQMSEDTINVEGNLNVNGSAVQTGTDAGATQLNVFEYGGLARTQYNNWFYGASTSYGHNYFYFFGTTGSTSTPTSWIDSIAPSFLVPRDGTITGYTIIGNNRSTDTWEWICMKGSQPTFGSAGNWSLSQIGATQSAGGTANILYKWETTGVSVSVDKNDMLAFFFRRTTDNDATYAYCEFSAYITME